MHREISSVDGMAPHVQLPREIAEFDFGEVAEVLRLRAIDGREKDCPPVPIPEIPLAIWEFRVFLALRRKYPDFPIVPSGRIDEVWHQSLWFTEMQQKLSAVVTPGGVFHHVPGFGLNPLGEQVLAPILRNTRRLFRKEYNDWEPTSYLDTTARQLLCGSGSGTVNLAKDKYLSPEEQEAILQGH